MHANMIVAAVFVALLSLIGVLFFGKSGHLFGTNRYVIPAAIGVFLGVVFFELVPETLEAGGEFGSIPIVVGFVGFYLLSYILHTYHHHHESNEADECATNKAGASMLLIGDAIHNFADGIIIATAFMLNPAVGIATTIGIALHEIPQEIAEFGVLLNAGYSKARAALLNLFSASSVILGALLTLLFISKFADYVWVLTGLAAGNLLYIAASDLLPDVHESSRQSGRVLQSFLTTLLALIAITVLISIVHEKTEGHEEDGPILQHDELD